MTVFLFYKYICVCSDLFVVYISCFLFFLFSCFRFPPTHFPCVSAFPPSSVSPYARPQSAQSKKPPYLLLLLSTLLTYTVKISPFPPPRRNSIQSRSNVRQAPGPDENRRLLVRLGGAVHAVARLWAGEGERGRVLPHHALQGGIHLRHHQHRRELRHRVRRPVVLAVRHRRQAPVITQGLPARRHVLVYVSWPFFFVSALFYFLVCLR